MTIREDTSGNLYYNHNPIGEGKRKAPDSAHSTPPHKGGGGTEADASAHTERTISQDVNLDFSVAPEAPQTYQLRAFHERRYQAAKAAGQTELTAQQWQQAHSPEFKAWFGDWQRLRAEERIDAMEPVELTLDEKYKDASPEGLREAVVKHLRDLAKAGVKAVHPELGEVGFAENKIGKIVSTSAATKKLHATLDIVRVIEAAHLVGSEGSYKKGQAERGFLYHTLAAKTSAFGREFVTIATVQQSATGQLFYNNIAVESGQKEAPVAYPRGAQSEDSDATSAFTGAEQNKLAPLRRVNREEVSKAINPHTGEPLVVYHGTGSKFTEFYTQSNPNYTFSGIFFSDNQEVAEGLGEGMPEPSQSISPEERAELLEHQRFLMGEPVAQLTGEEFAEKQGGKLRFRIADWYAERRNSVVDVEGLGSIKLDSRAIEQSLRHGGKGRPKVAAFAAVPDVLRKGRIIHREPLHGTKYGDFVHVAAPIEVGSISYIADVVVKADRNGSRMYLHDVVLKESLRLSAYASEEASRGGGAAVSAAEQQSASADAGVVDTVLRRVFSVKADEAPPRLATSCAALMAKGKRVWMAQCPKVSKQIVLQPCACWRMCFAVPEAVTKPERRQKLSSAKNLPMKKRG